MEYADDLLRLMASNCLLPHFAARASQKFGVCSRGLSFAWHIFDKILEPLNRTPNVDPDSPPYYDFTDFRLPVRRICLEPRQG